LNFEYFYGIFEKFLIFRFFEDFEGEPEGPFSLRRIEGIYINNNICVNLDFNYSNEFEIF